jgi:phosphate starvation-inducible PhoH-like protein
VLEGVDGVAFVHFGPKDVVRHPLVQKIVAAYAREDERENGGDGQ